MSQPKVAVESMMNKESGSEHRMVGRKRTTEVHNSPKKKTSPKKKNPKMGDKKQSPSHPTYLEMAEEAVAKLQERKGASRISILKYILANFPLGEATAQISARLRAAMMKGLETGVLVKISGLGMNGRFKLAKKTSKKSSKKMSDDDDDEEEEEEESSKEMPKKSAPKKKMAEPKKKPAEGAKKSPKKAAPKMRKTKATDSEGEAKVTKRSSAQKQTKASQPSKGKKVAGTATPKKPKAIQKKSPGKGKGKKVSAK